MRKRPHGHAVKLDIETRAKLKNYMSTFGGRRTEIILGVSRITAARAIRGSLVRVGTLLLIQMGIKNAEVSPEVSERRS